MIEGLDNRLKLFLEDKTYTYFKDIFNYNFNGFIIKIEENKFLFNDDKLGEIWINKSDIKTISFSTRNKEEKNDLH
jgi:hypothetical protein|tara:strand:+ start:645 stop:872 length:228 start_codon:yes stop_codon:yes gene_type:complete